MFDDLEGCVLGTYRLLFVLIAACRSRTDLGSDPYLEHYEPGLQLLDSLTPLRSPPPISPTPRAPQDASPAAS
jgi:hypothetical protein